MDSSQRVRGRVLGPMLAVLAVLAVGLAIGCGGETDKCKDVTCKAGEKCVDGVCKPAGEVPAGEDKAEGLPTDGGDVKDENKEKASLDGGDEKQGDTEPPREAIDCPQGCPDCSSTTKPVEKDVKEGGTCVLTGSQTKGDQANCAKDLVCLEAASYHYCFKKCQADADCKQGQKCLSGYFQESNVCGTQGGEGEKCDYTEQQFCASGVTCLITNQTKVAGQCYKKCEKDLDCTLGKACKQLTSSSKFCDDPVLPGPRCIGEACNDTQTGTNCIQGLICKDGNCLKQCTRATGDKDCDTKNGESCWHPFGEPKGYCIPKPAVFKEGEKCSSAMPCGTGLRCVQIGTDSRICATQCDETKGEDNNPDCASGKKCQKRSGEELAYCRGESDVLGPCGIDNCKKDLRCVFLSGSPQPVCFTECDPCKQVRNKEGEWVHPACENGKVGCVALTSGGKPSGGICLPSGDKSLGEGQNCGVDYAKSCKDAFLCVRFSSADGATGVCSAKCDPTAEKNPECDGGKGRCGKLTSGAGACEPNAKKIKKLGELCGGDPGTPSFNECLDEDNGKKLVCANPPTSGSLLPDRCMVRCNASTGSIDNADCKKAGLNSHLCIPVGDGMDGACFEKCAITNRLACESTKCANGKCYEFRQGDCKTEAEKKNCTTIGGVCANNLCLVTVCM